MAEKAKILVADDELTIRELLSDLLSDSYIVKTASNGQEVLDIAPAENFDLILLDLRMPKVHGLDVIRKLREKNDNATIIVITADKDADSAVEAMKLGVYDYIVKPFDNEKICILVKNALKNANLEKEVLHLRKEIHGRFAFTSIIGKSKKMKDLINQLERVIDNDSPILLSGEGGTGMELIARTMHFNSHRKNGPFIAVDCGAILDSHLENELFGHEKGAVEGSFSQQIGKMELASGGTLFLDEIHKMSTDVQAKLARTLQDKEFSRIGSRTRIPINIRILATTQVDLEMAVQNKTFRKDLFYQLNIIPLKIPALRDRKEDIPLLISHFLKKFNTELGKDVSFSKGAFEVFQDYYWPGNVRELENMVQRIVVMKTSGAVTENDLPQEILNTQHYMEMELPDGLSLYQLERKYIFKSLKENNWNISKTARALGITRKTLHNKLNRYEEEGTMRAELQEQPLEKIAQK